MFAKIQREVNDLHFEPLSRTEFEVLSRAMPALVDSTDRALKPGAHLVPSKTRRQPV